MPWRKGNKRPQRAYWPTQDRLADNGNLTRKEASGSPSAPTKPPLLCRKVRQATPGTGPQILHGRKGWVYPRGLGPMTAHPERGPSEREFETRPDWVPGMDTVPRFAPSILKTMCVHGFDHSANWPAKVRNASTTGNHTFVFNSLQRLDP
jgi:hypothetical protein